MKQLTVTRKRKFASGVLPYWVIPGVRKEAFLADHQLEGDLCPIGSFGQAVPRVDIQELDRVGIRIANGQTLTLELTDQMTTLFVSTLDGSFSGEVSIDPYIAAGKPVVITTTGGFAKLPHPVIEE